MSTTIVEFPKHIVLAATEGPRAGLKAYEAVASKSGLPQVKRGWRKFSKLNAKGRFTLYCDTFGDKITEAQADLGVERPVKDNAVQRTRKIDAIQAIIEQMASLQEQLNTLVQGPADKPVKTAKPKAAKSVPAAEVVESTFSAAVVERKNLPTKVGTRFTYKGANGSSKWVVTASNKVGITAKRAA